MPRSSFKILFLILTLSSCGESDTKESAPRPMVYEGMSSAELRDVLGEPKKIDTKNEIFDAQSMTKMSLEQWVYEKRIVLLINDTVKNPNIDL